MRPSKIGWTDYSGGMLNFVVGCTPVSRGCAYCYARTIYGRHDKDSPIVQCHEDKLERLLERDFPIDSRKHPGHPPMAFVCDTGDLFHEDVPTEFITHAFEVMAARQDVTWQILTKRPQRVADALYGSSYLGGGDYLPSVWLGVSVEDQVTADKRIPLLLETPAAVRFVSVGPMLEPVDLSKWLGPVCGETFCEQCGDCLACYGEDPCVNGGEHVCPPFLDWVICGGESGPIRRPFDVAWAVDLYGQCKEAGVPFFGKQDSGLYPGKPLLIDGREIKEWPEEVV